MTLPLPLRQYFCSPRLFLLGILLVCPFPFQCYFGSDSDYFFDGGRRHQHALFLASSAFIMPPLLPHSSPSSLSVQRSSAVFRNHSNISSASSIAPRRQRRNHNIMTTSSTTTTTTRLHSFFGLGPAELAIVAVASLIVIGPSKLLQFSKEAGNIAGKTAASITGEEWSDELKNIPEEFRKGVELGEIEARSRKAKMMEDVEKEEDDNVHG